MQRMILTVFSAFTFFSFQILGANAQQDVEQGFDDERFVNEVTRESDDESWFNKQSKIIDEVHGQEGERLRRQHLNQASSSDVIKSPASEHSKAVIYNVPVLEAYRAIISKYPSKKLPEALKHIDYVIENIQNGRPKHCYFYKRPGDTSVKCEYFERFGVPCPFWHDESGEYWEHKTAFKKLYKKAQQDHRIEAGCFLCLPSSVNATKKSKPSSGRKALPAPSDYQNTNDNKESKKEQFEAERLKKEKDKEWKKYLKDTQIKNAQAFKRLPCHFFHNKGWCKYGNDCRYFHSQQPPVVPFNQPGPQYLYQQPYYAPPVMPFPEFAPQNFYQLPYYLEYALPVEPYPSYIPYSPQQPWQDVIYHNGVPSFCQYLPIAYFPPQNFITNGPQNY